MYFLPREEVKNCFHVINEALDKFQIRKNTTGSLKKVKSDINQLSVKFKCRDASSKYYQAVQIKGRALLFAIAERSLILYNDSTALF